MSECSRPEMRDRLPDLIHDRLDAAARAEVVAHVAGCAVCNAELELLRQAHAVLVARTPRVDVAKIVSALPKPNPAISPKVIPLRPRRRWADWKIAAAITVIAVGGGTFAVTRHGTSPVLAPDSVSVPSVNAAPRQIHRARPHQFCIADSQSATKPSRTVAAAQPNPTPTRETASLEMTGRLGELSDAQLEALLKTSKACRRFPSPIRSR